MRQNRVHLMPPMSNFYARICVKATPSSNTRGSSPGLPAGNSVKDSQRKLILTLDNNPAADCDGIVCLNALDWLMGR